MERRKTMIFDRKKLITGIPLIDEQHQNYINMVEEILEPQAGADLAGERLETELEKAVTYVSEHFDAEEFLMQSAAYPHYEEHVSKHDDLRDKIDSLLLNLDANAEREDLLLMLQGSLVDWFETHVLSEDMKLAAFLRKTGYVK